MDPRLFMFPFSWMAPLPPTPVVFKNLEVGDLVYAKKKGVRSGSAVLKEIKDSAYLVEFRDGEIIAFDKGDLVKELLCPLPGCRKPNEVGITTCWGCGNRLPLVPP